MIEETSPQSGSVPTAQDDAPATCSECYKPLVTEPVQLRQPDRSWADAPSLRRCANEECWALYGGKREERLAFVQDTYSYKYFGDYELSPQQVTAVWEALALAKAGQSVSSSTCGIPEGNEPQKDQYSQPHKGVDAHGR